jgi:predicted nucleic acid-binding protein
VGVEAAAGAMTSVFIDSSYWIALRSRTEVNYQTAREVGARLVRERAALMSTTFVFGEIYAWFSRNERMREQVIQDFWEQGSIRLVDPSHADQKSALQILRQHTDKDFSFCDAVSFVVMRRFQVRCAAAFDEHFRQFGEFEVIP